MYVRSVQKHGSRGDLTADRAVEILYTPAGKVEAFRRLDIFLGKIEIELQRRPVAFAAEQSVYAVEYRRARICLEIVIFKIIGNVGIFMVKFPRYVIWLIGPAFFIDIDGQLRISVGLIIQPCGEGAGVRVFRVPLFQCGAVSLLSDLLFLFALFHPGGAIGSCSGNPVAHAVDSLGRRYKIEIER